MRLEDHPTVKWFRDSANTGGKAAPPSKLDAEVLKELCLQSGAEDLGFVEIDRPALSEEKQELLAVMPDARTLVSLAFRLNAQAVRSAAHSVTSLEFHHLWDHANRTGRTIVAALQKMGIRALNAPAGFPYDAARWPGRMWFTNDKVIAVEAGVGRMGWNRIVLHPRLGANMVLGTILVAAELTSYNAPLDYNPCIECKLCVSVCPVGAIGSDGPFNFVSCYTHNYRERLGGFVNWIEQLVASKTVPEYRQRVSDSETVSMWQNLSIVPQTRCDRCVAVCPAGEENIGEYLTDRQLYGKGIVKTFRDKLETIYVIAGSDAEAHVTTKFSHKTPKRVSAGLRPISASGFLKSLPIMFQRVPSAGLDATFHFTFTGDETVKATVVIRDGTIGVSEDHVGKPDLHLIADSRTWVDFLAGEKNILWAMVTGKIRAKGSLKLMKAFAACFPS